MPGRNGSEDRRARLDWLTKQLDESSGELLGEGISPQRIRHSPEVPQNRGASSAGQSGMESTSRCVERQQEKMNGKGAPVRVGGMLVIPGFDDDSQSKQRRSRSFNPEVLQKAYSDIAECEKPTTTATNVGRRAQPSNANAVATRSESQSAQDIQRSRLHGVTFERNTFAKYLEDGIGSEGSGDMATLDNDTRKAREQLKEERRARRAQSRAALQLDAEEAKIAYGLSSFEKRERERREEKMLTQQEASRRGEASVKFARHSRLVTISNFIALATQIFHVLDTYQAIDEPPNSGNSTKSYANEFHLPRAELPRNAFFYSACGIIGSALSIWAVVILWSLIFAQSKKTNSNLAAVAPLALYVFYVSRCLQSLSLLNFFANMGDIVVRIAAQIGHSFSLSNNAAATGYGIGLVVGMVATIVLPVLVVYNITMNRMMVYDDLVGLSPEGSLQKHMFRGLAFAIWLNSSVLMYYASEAVSRIVELTSQVKPLGEGLWSRRLAPDDVSAGVVMQYPYFAALGLGGLGVVLGITYWFVTEKSSLLQSATQTMEKAQENMANSHKVSPVPGYACRVVHLIEKPHLNGRRGIISKSANQHGKIAVRIQGVQDEVLVEEFQMTADLDPEEIAKRREFASLRVADMKEKHLQHVSGVNASEKVYVIFGQLSVGMSATAFILLVRHALFGANVIYQFIVKYVDPSSPTYAPSVRLNRQDTLCAEWAQCIGSQTPRLCGTCNVPAVTNYDAQANAWGSANSYTEGNPFAGESLTWLIVYAAIVGALGCVSSGSIMRENGKARWCYVLVVGLCNLMVFGAVGMAISTLPPVFSTNIDVLNTDRCGERIIDEELVDVVATDDFSVSVQCIETIAARSLAQMATNKDQLAILVPHIVLSWNLVESIVILSQSVARRNPFEWARFGMTISFSVTLILAIATAFWSVYMGQSPQLPIWNARYNEALEAAATATQTTPGFPLAYNETITDYHKAAVMVFYTNPTALVLVLIIVAAIQIVGLYFTTCISTQLSTVKVARGTLVAIVLNFLAMPFVWPFITYVSMESANVLVNIYLIFTVPTLVQFLFGCNNALGTEILPVHELVRGGSACVMAGVIFVCMLPVALLIGLSLSAALLFLTDDPELRQTYFSLLIAFIVMLVLFLSCVVILAGRQASSHLVAIFDYVKIEWFGIGLKVESTDNAGASSSNPSSSAV